MSRFADLVLIWRIANGPTGGGGVDDFNSWVAAGRQIWRDDRRLPIHPGWNPHCEP